LNSALLQRRDEYGFAPLHHCHARPCAGHPSAAPAGSWPSRKGNGPSAIALCAKTYVWRQSRRARGWRSL